MIRAILAEYSVTPVPRMMPGSADEVIEYRPMSAIGTKRTCLWRQSMSAFGQSGHTVDVRIISWPPCTARRSPCAPSRSSTIKLYHDLAKPNASERIGHWSVNRKHCELESVAGLHFGTKYHAIGQVLSWSWLELKVA